MDYILLLIGFVLLIKGADILIDGAGSIAKKFGIPSIVIGLTIVAFGTSAPEFVVSFLATLDGKTNMAIANVVGSNIVNVFLILGIVSLIFPIKMPHNTVKMEIPFAILISIFLLVMVSDKYIGFGKENNLGFIDGIILLSLFGFFMYYIYVNTKKSNIIENSDIKDISKMKSILFIFFGFFGLIVGGKLIVDSSVIIAKSFGISDVFIGLTIVSIGTSLPELASSITAALKKNSDMAIGTIIGSNIFNILWILGFSSLFKGLDGYNGLEIDLLVMIFGVILLLIFGFVGKKYFLGKYEGLVLVLIYISYISFLIFNL